MLLMMMMMTADDADGKSFAAAKMGRILFMREVKHVAYQHK